MPTTTTDKPAAAPKQPQGPTLEEAALRMEGLLDLREASQGLTKDAEQEAHTDDGEGVAETEAQETTDETVRAEGEATEAEGETEATETEQPMVTVTIDGKTEQVTLDEVAKGYQRYSDYSRKTAELANQRRELEAQAKAVGDERQTYATMLAALRDQLTASREEEPDWNKVYEADPVGYARRRDEWRDKHEKIAAANFELQRLHGLQQEENAKQLSQMVQKGRAKMLDLMPAWKDQKVWESDRQAIVQYAQSAGYSPEEIAQAYDPRAIVSLHKARLYDELMAKKPMLKPVRTGPRVASAGASNEANVATRLNAAQQRLAKSGRLEDAAKVFEALI